MRNNFSYQRSDSWILLAVIFGEGKEGADLRSILSAADYVNHGLPTYDELSGGLVRLIAGGHVERQGEHYRPGTKALAAFNAVWKPGRQVIKGWKALDKFLENAPIGESFDGEPISLKAYQRAVAEYLATF